MRIDLQSIRTYFSHDRYAMNSGISIEQVDVDCVKCSMPISAEHLNAAGGVQGGAIFTLADLTFAVHANLPNLCGEGDPVVGQSCSISYLKAPKGNLLASTSRCLSRGRTISVFLITIVDELGREVATVLCNGVAKQT
jgi:acyl-CoA thioesterase